MKYWRCPVFTLLLVVGLASCTADSDSDGSFAIGPGPIRPGERFEVQWPGEKLRSPKWVLRFVSGPDEGRTFVLLEGFGSSPPSVSEAGEEFFIEGGAAVTTEGVLTIDLVMPDGVSGTAELCAGDGQPCEQVEVGP